MATSQLKLYNRALLHLGERSLSALDDAIESRRSLDQAWDSGTIRDEWLAEGLWNFAIRTTAQNYESGLDPDFGFRRAFTKPSDCIRTAMVCSDEYFKVPLTRYEDERGYLFADLDVIYFSYVSNDASYGYDYSLWPEQFTRFCEYDLACKIARRVTGADRNDLEAMKNMRKSLLSEAKNTDAMDEPARFPPQGTWATSRTRMGSGRRRNLGDWY